MARVVFTGKQWQADRRKSRAVIEEGDKTSFNLPNATLAAGTADLDVVIGLLEQLTSVGLNGRKLSENEMAFITAVMRDLRPEDTAEAMLIMQLGLMHQHFINTSAQLAVAMAMDEIGMLHRVLAQVSQSFARHLVALETYRVRKAERVALNEPLKVSRSAKRKQKTSPAAEAGEPAPEVPSSRVLQ